MTFVVFSLFALMIFATAATFALQTTDMKKDAAIVSVPAIVHVDCAALATRTTEGTQIELKAVTGQRTMVAQDMLPTMMEGTIISATTIPAKMRTAVGQITLATTSPDKDHGRVLHVIVSGSGQVYMIGTTSASHQMSSTQIISAAKIIAKAKTEIVVRC